MILDDKKSNDSTKYAARSFHPELCKFLDDSGADKSAPTYNAR